MKNNLQQIAICVAHWTFRLHFVYEDETRKLVGEPKGLGRIQTFDLGPDEQIIGMFGQSVDNNANELSELGFIIGSFV